MKARTKTILGVALVAFCLMSQSCEKDYECHCEKKAGGEEHVDIKAKKKDAEAACDKIAADASTIYSSCEVE